MLRQLGKAVLYLFAARRLATGYIDPNSGGLVFQILAVLFGLISGVLLFFSSQIRRLFSRVMRFIRERREREEDPVL